jgi:glycosyltransferase involved in cell wall biosynthesis
MMSAKTVTKEHQPLRVGFDLDGVILYNPARIFRPFVAIFKKNILHKRKTKFYIPRSPFEQWLFRLFHLSSLFIAPGFKDIPVLVKNRQIKAYLITGRFAFLKSDLDRWLKKINAYEIFDQIDFNKLNEQPHLFKAKKLADLNLDIFIEDNLDIVTYLQNEKQSGRLKTETWWISNIFDHSVDYSAKYSSLKQAITVLKTRLLDNKKPSILIVTDYFYPHWTGIASAVFRLSQIIKTFSNVTVLTVRHDIALPRQSDLKGIKIIRATPLINVSRAKYSLDLVRRAHKLIPFYDIVLINTPFTNVAPISLLAKRARKKLLVFHHGDLILTPGFFNRLLERIFDLSMAIALKKADKVSTYTEDYARHSRVLKPYLSKFQPIIIPPAFPIKNKPLTSSSTLQNLRDQYPILCGFAGRFVEEKGFDLLLKAIPEICRNSPVHFLYVGKKHMGYENFYDRNLNYMLAAKPYLTDLGFFSPNQMSDFYAVLDFIIIPSRSDCFPFVQAEAMLAGVPSIVTNIPGARYPVKSTGFGVIVEPNNVHDLVAKVLYALKHRPQIITHFPKVQALFNYEQNAETIKQFFID